MTRPNGECLVCGVQSEASTSALGSTAGLREINLDGVDRPLELTTIQLTSGGARSPGQQSKANDGVALTRTGKEDDAVTRRLVKTKARIKEDAPIYLFATAPHWACLHDIGRRDLRGLRCCAIDGTSVTGPFKSSGRNHASRDR